MLQSVLFFAVHSNRVEGCLSCISFDRLYFILRLTLVVFSEIHLDHRLIKWQDFLELFNLIVLAFHSLHVVLELDNFFLHQCKEVFFCCLYINDFHFSVGLPLRLTGTFFHTMYVKCSFFTFSSKPIASDVSKQRNVSGLVET